MCHSLRSPEMSPHLLNRYLYIFQVDVAIISGLDTSPEVVAARVSKYFLYVNEFELRSFFSLDEFITIWLFRRRGEEGVAVVWRNIILKHT